MTHTTIKNCFKKAELGIPLGDGEIGRNEINDEFNMEELISAVDELTIENINDFMNIDNDDSDELIEAILEDIDAELHSTEEDPVEDDEEEQMDQEAPDGHVATFAGWDAIYQSVRQLHTDLYHPCAVETVGDQHEELIDAYESLKRLVRKVHQQQQHERVASARQLTLHDCFS